MEILRTVSLSEDYDKYAIIALNPEKRSVRWVEPSEGKGFYTTRQAAHRRRDQLEEKMNAVKHQGFVVYTREIDYGQGVQTVYAKDGKVVKQFIDAAEGMHHSYTGAGNPEWVGQDVSVLRGNGFKRLRNKDRVDEIELEWLQEY